MRRGRGAFGWCHLLVLCRRVKSLAAERSRAASQTQLDLPPDAVVLIAVLCPAGSTRTAAPQPQAVLQSGLGSSAPASEQNGAGPATPATPHPADSAALDPTSAREPDTSTADGAAEAAAASGVFYPSPAPEDADDGSAERLRPAAGGDLLVGTFEVAFTERARTKELTLNPPSVRIGEACKCIGGRATAFALARVPSNTSG